MTTVYGDIGKILICQVGYNFTDFSDDLTEQKPIYFHGQSADNAGVKPETDPSFEEARLAGFDLNLIEINLSLLPEERWRQHDMALAVIQEFEEARRTRDAGFQKSAGPTR